MKKVKSVKSENYIKLSFIILLVIILTIIPRNIYLNKINEKNTASIVYNKLKRTIGSEEVYSYLLENNNTILYLSSRSLDNNALEDKIVEILENENLLDEVIYLDITEVNDKDKYLNDFYSRYNMEGITNYPIFIAFKDNKIVDVLLSSDVNKKNLIEFFDRNVVE